MFKYILRPDERLNRELDIIERYCGGCNRWQQSCKFPFTGNSYDHPSARKPITSKYCHSCRNAVRTKRIKFAMPKWVNKQEIRKIYANCPEGHHVDHIIPIRGKNVSGLHVPWNLQYLPVYENYKKGNRLV